MPLTLPIPLGSRIRPDATEQLAVTSVGPEELLQVLIDQHCPVSRIPAKLLDLCRPPHYLTCQIDQEAEFLGYYPDKIRPHFAVLLLYSPPNPLCNIAMANPDYLARGFSLSAWGPPFSPGSSFLLPSGPHTLLFSELTLSRATACSWRSSLSNPIVTIVGRILESNRYLCQVEGVVGEVVFSHKELSDALPYHPESRFDLIEL